MDGVAKLIGSQVATRLATFCLNQVITRALSVEVFGLLAIRFHLINTTVLMLSREGVRRGSLRTEQGGGKGADELAVLKLASLALPLGVLVTAATCWFFWPAAAEASIPGYRGAVLLQGGAALLELASEPLFVLATVRGRFGLRVRVEAAATGARIAATLLLLQLRVLPEAVALSLAQGVFAAVLLVGYLWHFWLGLRALGGVGVAKQAGTAAGGGRIRRQDLLVCANFTGQAVEKLLLAEGTKVVVALVRDAYDQGVYGLVINLGSVAVRTLLQPFEEAAFIAFSRQPPGGYGQPLATLLPLLRVALLCGLLATAFGPSNTYLLLHALYGAKYSSTEAPVALAAYCPYILLLAANGLLESYVHATARGAQLLHGHAALILTTGLQAAATLVLARTGGTLGMISADALGMLLRIAYCCAVIWGSASGKHHRSTGGSPAARLADALPSAGSLLALAGAAAASSASAAALLGKGPLAGALPSLGWPFWRGAAAHVGLEAVVLGATLLVVHWTERPLWQALRQVRRKQE